MQEPRENTFGMDLPPGLYDYLLSHLIEDSLLKLADPRLYEIAEVEADEAHNAVAQYVEHFLAGSLAQFRGADGAERRHRLVTRLIELLREELGTEWSSSGELLLPLRRLLAVHA